MSLDESGHPEPDPELRDSESVPLSEAIESFFEREVKPHVPDAWIDIGKRDEKDGLRFMPLDQPSQVPGSSWTARSQRALFSATGENRDSA